MSAAGLDSARIFFNWNWHKPNMAFFKSKSLVKRNQAPKEVVHDVVPFQDGIGTVLEDRPSAFMMSTYYIIVGLLAVMVTIAFIAETDSVVVGAGRLATVTPPIQLQPVDRAIIREFKVKAGDVVTKGQVLATFDPTFARSDLISLEAQQQSLMAQVRRLESELNDTDFLLDSHSNADAKLQHKLLNQRRVLYKSHLAAFHESIQGIQANIRAIKASRGPLRKLLAISKDVEAKRRSLANSGSGTKLEYQESQVTSIRTERDLQDANNRLIELHHSLLSRKAEKQTFAEDWIRQIIDQLVVVRTELAKINESVVKAKRINDFEALTAPTDGVLLSVAERTAGAVLPGAEVLITLLPSDAVLVGEVMISSKDIGFIKPGDEVVVKINAFPYRKHGMLKGTLEFISQESYSGGKGAGGGGAGDDGSGGGGAMHVGRVKLHSTKLRNLPEGIRLIRGMTMSAEIKVATRSIASYVLFPITRTFSESMREP